MMKKIAPEVLIDLYHRLELLPVRSSQRRDLINQAAQLYDVSDSTLYRQLRAFHQPKSMRRCDLGEPRSMNKNTMEQYCEVIAALKIRTMNKNGRHISTVRAIEVLETIGIESNYGFIKPPKGTLVKTTINRYLKRWGFNQHNLIKNTPAIRFQAQFSNECWQFDLSPSDLKHVKEPLWYDKSKGKPILMMYSIVDDRSGVCYQEYRNVYGEDVSSALLFLFNAMNKKSDPSVPFSGIPNVIYTDNGPIAKSHIFLNVMTLLGVEVKTHIPDSKDKRRKTARSKGKVERAFRTVKECHEVLYHLREPKNEVEANHMLFDYLKQYNDHAHRSGDHSRIDDWVENIKPSGLREMCSWERFCAFAREPEKRTTGIDARISVDGTVYEISPELAGEKVILWWGLFDDELYIEFEGERFGPYYPISGPIPLSRYRKFKKTKIEKKLDKLEALADSLNLPDNDTSKNIDIIKAMKKTIAPLSSQAFVDPDPFNEITFDNKLKAKLAIANYLGKPLSLLSQEDKNNIESILNETLDKAEVMSLIKEQFNATWRNRHAT